MKFQTKIIDQSSIPFPNNTKISQLCKATFFSRTASCTSTAATFKSSKIRTQRSQSRRCLISCVLSVFDRNCTNTTLFPESTTFFPGSKTSANSNSNPSSNNTSDNSRASSRVLGLIFYCYD